VCCSAQSGAQLTPPHTHTQTPTPHPGEPLLLLPAFHIPLANVTFHITCKMPRGRNPLLHHAFPIHASPPPPGAVQPFVDVFALMKCEGWSLGIDLAVNSDRTQQQVGGRHRGGGVTGSPGGSPMASRLPGAGRLFRPLRVPHVYIGEFQVGWG